MPAILYLALAFHPGVDTLAVRLGDPSFKVRDQAERQLQSRMSYALALRLEFIRPANIEAACRLRRLVNNYYAGPCWIDCPFLDALNFHHNCGGCITDWQRRYFRVACAADPRELTDVSWPEYRLGTALMLEDLRRWRVPPAAVRVLLAVMKKRSDDWENGRK